MATRLNPPQNCRTTDHTEEIERLRRSEAVYARFGTNITNTERTIGLAYAVAADLLQAHDDTGISLDNWLYARNLVEHLLEAPILENGV